MSAPFGPGCGGDDVELDSEPPEAVAVVADEDCCGALEGAEDPLDVFAELFAGADCSYDTGTIRGAVVPGCTVFARCLGVLVTRALGCDSDVER